MLSAVVLFSILFTGHPMDASAAEKEMTLFFYICGSNLESGDGQATDDIREMLSSGIGKSEQVNVILATGGSTEWQNYGISSKNVQYHRLGENGLELLKDVGRKNMGDAATLSSFLSYGLSQAPAKRYMLIFWDHGGGPVFGLCNDENYNDDSLSLTELQSALKNGLGKTRMDIIGFDCCLMNCIDLCADLQNVTTYSVLSQELVNGTGLNYDKWMKLIVDDAEVTSEQIARSMADSYVQENSQGRMSGTATMSVIASDKMPAVVDAANVFSSALSSLMKSNLSGVIRVRSQLLSFGEFMDEDASDLVDVEDMCDAFSALIPKESAQLKQAAQQAVCYNCTTQDIASYAHGLSFFMPKDTVYSDKQEILNHYSVNHDAYSSLAVALTNQTASSGYSMSASSYTPSSFYECDDYGCSGEFCDIWDGYYGDYCSFDELYDTCGSSIWGDLNPSSGSIWDGYTSSAGIWEGYTSSSGSTPSVSGIWAGLPSETEEPAEAASDSSSAALNNIWQGLLNPGSDYYQQGEENQNVQAGISEAVTADSVLETANEYFSNATLTSQLIYSLQLNKEDLDHLSTASGVLTKVEGKETIRLGDLGKTTIDWSTGLIFSMFDGSWPMLGDQMVRVEFLYTDEAGNMRFVIPAKINGLKMYLLGKQNSDGRTEILGATQGYDENGFAIRGSIPLEKGMTIYPLFTAVSSEGTEREYEGKAVNVPSEGLQLTWDRIPNGDYLYCFALKDIYGQVHYTDSIPISF